MAQHTEVWQVFDSTGTPVQGEGISPLESRKTDKVIVGAVHAWIWRRTNTGGIEVLLQHRAVDKPTWPDYLDISVAGHIDKSEDVISALQREALEEVGVTFEADRLEYIFGYRNFQNGIKWVYLYEQVRDVKYTFNDGEVQGLKWVTLDTFDQMLKAPEENNLVPHPVEYFSLLLKALRHFL